MVAGADITDVVFDFCGVLVDRRVTRALDGFYPENQIEEFFAYDDRSGFHYFDDLLDRGVPADTVLEQCRSERGEQGATMLACYIEHMDLCYESLVPGVADVLRELADAGMRIWALTNMSMAGLHTVLDRFPPLAGYLSGCLASAEAGVTKPDPALFRMALHRFGIDPDHALFVDDNSINVAASEREGMRGVTFIDMPHLRNSLRRLGIDVAAPRQEELEEQESIMLENHDGASACATSHILDQDLVFTPDNGTARGVWRAVRLGSIGLPKQDEDFWAERCREYRALQWNRIDWNFVQEQLERVARELGTLSCSQPEIVISGGSERERTFLEQWFGYGDEQCSLALKGGRLQVISGQHRLLAVSNRPVAPRDAKLLDLKGRAFSAKEALGNDTLLPFFVRDAA